METLEIKIRRLEILEDTCKYFNLEKRNNINNDKCRYFPQHKNTEGCAIGRLIENKQLCKHLDSFDNESGIGYYSIFEKLPQELKELGQQFLIALQLLHDTHSNWNEEGLSESGQKDKINIIQEYC